MARVAFWLFSAACFGCGGAETPSEPGEPGPVTSSLWQLTAVEDDPYAEHRAGRVPCGQAAVLAELGGIEVKTETCNYATLVHETLRRVPAGGRIEGEVSWLSVVALEPAIATLSVRLEGDELWTREVDIPAPAEVAQVEVTVPRETPAGSRLYFHVRNHGYNSWHVNQLMLVAE